MFTKKNFTFKKLTINTDKFNHKTSINLFLLQNKLYHVLNFLLMFDFFNLLTL